MFNSNIKSNQNTIQLKRQTIIVKREELNNRSSGQSLQVIRMHNTIDDDMQDDDNDNADSNQSNNQNNDHNIDDEEDEEVLEDCDEEEDDENITIEAEDGGNTSEDTSEAHSTVEHITHHTIHSGHHFTTSQQHSYEEDTGGTSGTAIQYTTTHAPHTTLALKTENGAQTGAVTYRVVQVGHAGGHHVDAHTLDAHAVVTTTGHALVAPQTIIATPFGGTPSQTGGAADGGVGGPFYVMMTTPTQEIIHTTSTAANTSATNAHTRRNKNSGHESGSGYAIGGQRAARDEKRRATHNEVERRRRDKINNWIMKLSKVVPDCQQDHTKQGQSKGGILAKATEYIQELCSENSRLNEVLKENEVLSNELDAIRQQFVDTKNENRRLRALLQRNGISESESNDALNTIN